jgi:hypothetical protein
VGQVIVTGEPDQIEQVAGIVGLEETGSRFTPKDQAAVYLYQTITDPDLLQQRYRTIPDLALDREILEIGIDWTVHQVTCEINALGAPYGVSASPNYYLSPAQWIGGGSPWTQNGGWSEGLEGGGLVTATVEAFQKQWAFGPMGIHLFDDRGIRWGQETGKRTRIAIFDTSPFDEAGWEGHRCDNCSIQQLTDNAQAFSGLDMTLNVWHQIDLIEGTTCPGYDRRDPEHRSLEGQDVSNHGLFVAGLAHAVAPSSEIYLVRVLEKDGCGTLYQIVEGIRTFMDEILEKEGTLNGTVINLSLGMHLAPDMPDFGFSNAIESLEAQLFEAVDKGAIVVAAAGNDSYKEAPDAPRVMELPAGYSFVTGVAASNDSRTRACFSNADMILGSINTAAPGGDGVYVDESKPCSIPDCKADDSNCLISLVYKPKPGYAYWVGTSFAAPLVSGQEALLLERWPDGDIESQEGENTCPSPDRTLPGQIINWARASGENCPAP